MFPSSYQMFQCPPTLRKKVFSASNTMSQYIIYLPDVQYQGIVLSTANGMVNEKV